MKKKYIQPSAEFEEIDDNLMEGNNSPYKPKGDDAAEMGTGDQTVIGGEGGGDTSDDDLLGGF
ncbi:MAG: hypothetical protein ILA44_00310 [Prevotella sp.]|nr:hypothetical protein [Prevotella sp.]MBP3749911.1 hypothetical protein [Prevotella sp.]